MEYYQKNGLNFPHKKQKCKSSQNSSLQIPSFTCVLLVKEELPQVADDLLKVLGKIYAQLMDIVSEELFPLVHLVLYHPLEDDVLLDQYALPTPS